jgi:dTDP-4-amino-4,6-dideoxy-D-galactose acyltransferase
MSNTRYQILDWDSQWFGIPIGRVDLPELTDSSASEVDMWARKQGLKCVYIFVANDQPDAKCPPGFKPMDVRVEYELNPLLLAKGPADTSASMRPDEQEKICTLARRLFTETRFSRDTGFPRARVGELYAEWVRRDSTGCIPGCQVIRDGNDIAGFVTGRMDPHDATRGSIGLLGVAESHQGRSLGKHLLDHACRVFVNSGVTRVTVVTQETNRAACRLYEQAGHIITRGRWYHRWY